MKKNNFKLSVIISVILIIIAAIIGGELSTNNANFVNNLENLVNKLSSTILNESTGTYSNSTIEEETKLSSETYKVIRVVDGDTIIIDYNGKEERIRLIGVDTPESVHPNAEKNTEFGKTASDFTKANLENKFVKIELDVQEHDKYGRLLAYIYVDGKMYNKTLLEEGYAKIATFPPNVKYVDDFKAIQKDAENNKKGLWGLE